jgi:hydroxymethylbilane synthase
MDKNRKKNTPLGAGGIKIGTRGSKLALWQAYYVEQKLQEQGAETEIVIIETKGDKILDKALSKIGSKGVFTEELEEQLRNGSIDIAVHSAKDLQSELDADFEIIAFTKREKVNDVVVSFNKDFSLKNDSEANSPSGGGGLIGTSSTRRVAMLNAYYPHIKVVDMRGNLQTRLRKLEEGHCDALLLAYAGVHRMEYDDLIVENLPIDTFTPAVGQGSVAVESSVNLDESKKKLIQDALNDDLTASCLIAERSFLKKLQGGCSIPVFGNCTIQDDTLTLTGGIISLDGQKIIRQTIQSPVNQAINLGESLAEKVLELGGGEILKEIRKGL